jgi:hypothetical protein
VQNTFFKERQCPSQQENHPIWKQAKRSLGVPGKKIKNKNKIKIILLYFWLP